MMPCCSYVFGAIAGNQASYNPLAVSPQFLRKDLNLLWLFITLSSCSFPGWKTLQTTLIYVIRTTYIEIMINMIDDKQGLGLTSHVNIEPSTLTYLEPVYPKSFQVSGN